MANRALANSLNSRPLTSRPLVNPHLRRDPRLKIWITRAIVAIVIMLGFTIGVSWRIGLTAAVIYVAADSVIRSKTTAVVPAGVRVTSAQRFTRRRLRVLQPAGYMALHARTIPGTRHVIDHVVIGPAGVFTLDSQRLDRRLPLRAIGGMLYHGKQSMEPRFDHATHEAKHAATLIARELGQRVRVKPVMVLYGPNFPWVIMKVKGVDVFDGSRVGTYFRRQTKAVAKHRLDASQIAMVLAAAARALPPLE
jgi:Nuclease-related domain